MSALRVDLRVDAADVPAIIDGSVNLLRFTEALARAGIVGRYDPDRGALVIEPQPNPAEALCGMAVYNGWSRQERMHWHREARSSVPADAWEAYKREGL